MESACRNEKIIFAFLLLVCFLVGCSKRERNVSEPLLLSEVRQGDLICRLGNGFFSNHFKDYSLSEKIYSHVGIIDIERDSLFVIHAEASELTGVGHVKKEPVSIFLEDIKTWGVYRLNASDSICKNIAINARRYYDNKTPFDLNFDALNDTEVYCTELVALAINKSFGDSIVKPQLSFGGKRMYGVDNVYLLPEIQIIKKVSK